MAAFTQTIAIGINALGMGPATRSSAATFGSDVFGEGSNDLPQKIGKFLANSITPTEVYSKKTTKLISESISPSMEMYEERKGDGSGYYYVFKKPDTNAEERTLAQWALTSDPSNSFTCVAGASTTWS
jgi:hypothetical protein